MGLLGLIFFGSRGTAEDAPTGPHVVTDTVDPTIVKVKDTKGKASGSSTVPVTANSTLANQIHTAARHRTFITDQPSHSPQPYASLTSESNKPNATFISTTKRYSPDWLLSHQHHRQQEESPSAPQDLRNRVGEDLWAPGWQSAPFQSSPFQPGSSQAFPLQRPPLLTPHGDSQGGGFDTSVAAAHNNKGKGVLFFHGHIPRGSARFSPDAGAIDPEAALTHKHKLEDMALNKPRQFVDRNGLVTPFFRKVVKTVIYKLQELQAEGKVHSHLTPAMVKVSDEGLVRVEGAVFEATRERQYSSQAYQLGVMLHFILTRGECAVLWAPNQLHQVLMGMDHLPSEADLIKLLLHVEAEQRPSLDTVLRHPCLWNDMQRLDLLVGLSNYLEEMGKGDVGLPSHFQHFLEQELGSAEGWQQAMHPDLLDNMTKYNKFRPGSWQDLLRFVRNMHRHYTPILRKMPPALQQALGRGSDGVYRYIAPKFPKLLITSYNFVQEYCSQETIIRTAETNLNMIRQVTTPVKPETKGTGSVPAGSATIPVTTVARRAAAGPAGPSAENAKGRAGPIVGNKIHRRPAVGHVSSEASRVGPVSHVITGTAARGSATGKAVLTHGPQVGMQRDTVLPGKAAARPTRGSIRPAQGHVGSSPGRVILDPRVNPGRVQAQQASQVTTEPGRQLNNHTAGGHGRGQNSQAQVTNSNQIRTHVMTVPQHPRPATGNMHNTHVSNVRGANCNQVFTVKPNASSSSVIPDYRPGHHSSSMPDHMHQGHSGYSHGSPVEHHMDSHMDGHMGSHMGSHPGTFHVQGTNFSNRHNGYRGKQHPSPANNMTHLGHGMTNGTGHSGGSSSGDSSEGVGRRAPAFQARVFHGDQEMKNAIWHFNNKAKTAEAACSIARSLELSIARSPTATRARALDWYLKVTKLSTEGPVKQYAEQRIAELQDLIAASLQA